MTMLDDSDIVWFNVWDSHYNANVAVDGSTVMQY